ncbi:MAG: ABC transporter permease [Caldilineaceae bacterium]
MSSPELTTHNTRQPDDDALAQAHQGLTAAAVRALLRHRTGMVGLSILLLLLALALAAPLLAPHDPLAMNTADRFAAPSAVYPMGADEFGRDLFSRLLFGGRVAFEVGALSILMASVIGVSIGLAAGYEMRWFDVVSMRLFDVILAFPAILLAIVILAVLGPGAFNAMLAVAIVNIPIFGRLARANVLAERHKEYVLAAQSIGARPGRILLRTILPNSLATIIVQATVSFASAVMLESALSFLGLGVPLPDPSWGSMLSIGRGYMSHSPWYALFPGAAIMLLVLSVYLLGDGLRDVLDPRRQKAF